MIVPLPPALIMPSIEALSERAPSFMRRLCRSGAANVLGTRLEVLVHAPTPVSSQRALQALHAEIERLNQVLNHRHGNTEVSGLQRVRRAQVSPDLFSVLELSELWRRLSHGAFDARIGALLQLWAGNATPAPHAIAEARALLRSATVRLDSTTRTAELSPAVALSLDAVAKGYIIDLALEAARCAVPTLEGIAVNIGGDIRCWGRSPSGGGWPIGVPAAAAVAENAPLVDAVLLTNAAIATSGIGPRDRRRHGYRSTTISPFTGYPVHTVSAASVVAGRAADADAIATACMVLPPHESIAMVDRFEGAAARITATNGRVHLSRRWPALQLTAQPGPHAHVKGPSQPPLPPQLRWPDYWELSVSYSAADLADQPDFRSMPLHDPYIAIWISDAHDKPVTTLLLLGTNLRWVKENFIWWDSWHTRAKKEVYSRSRPTTRSGQYDMEWLGVDEDLNPVPIGKYVLHFETSREHGRHTHRAVPLQIGRQRFQMSVPDLDGMGSLDIAFRPYIVPAR